MEINGNKILFRYRKNDDQFFDAIKNNQLFFSRPVNFNDPFDSLMYINKSEFLESVLNNILFGQYNKIINYQNELGVNAGLKQVSFSKEYLESNLIYIDNFIKELDSKIDIFIESVRNNSEIICFSEDYLSMLMWSHYANNHKGFAIGYNLSDLEKATRFNSFDKSKCDMDFSMVK